MNRLGNPRVSEGLRVSSVAVPALTGSASLLEILWWRRWVLLLAPVVCLAAAFAYLTKATPIYTTTSRLYVEKSGPNIIGENEGIMTRSNNYLYTQCEMLTSAPILATVAQEPEISRMKMFAGVDNLVGCLKAAVSAQVGKNDDIISVSLNSPYPQEAAQIVNAVVDSYITYHSARKRTTSAEVLKILQKEKDKWNQELRDQLKALMQFKQDNVEIAFETAQGNIISQRLASLQELLTQAQLDTIDAKARFEAITSMIGDPAKVRQYVQGQPAKGAYLSTGSDETYTLSELHDLDLRLFSLKLQAAMGHPVVKGVQDRMNELKQRLEGLDQQFAQSQVAVAKQQYQMAQDKVQQLKAFFEEQRHQMISLNSQMAKYTMLQADIEQTKRTCDLLYQRIKEINVTEDTGALNITVLEVAHPTSSPTSPNRSRILAIALVLGLMLGGAGAFALEYMDHRLCSMEEIVTVLGIPALGTLPSMSAKESNRVRGQKVRLEPTSPVAEAYRTIRTAVHFGVPKGQAKTMLVTSPDPGDGKTTLASNLAITMSQAGQRTLLMDADFRRPMQHTIFGLDNDKGLSSILAGHTSRQDGIRQTEAGLDVMTSGPTPPNPSELLNSQAFIDLVEELCGTYDRIVLDSPPVMPVTDARILSAMCDVTLLVLRAQKSTRKSSQQARDELLSVGGQILGVVINAVPRKRNRYSYYSGYGYYRPYGYHGQGEHAAGHNGRTHAVVKAASGDNS